MCDKSAYVLRAYTSPRPLLSYNCRARVTAALTRDPRSGVPSGGKVGGGAVASLHMIPAEEASFHRTLSQLLIYPSIAY